MTTPGDYEAATWAASEAADYSHTARRLGLTEEQLEEARDDARSERRVDWS